MFGKRLFKRKKRAEQKRIRQEERKREIEKRIRFHAEKLTEEMNLRLICGMGVKNTLWVDTVIVTEIRFPDNERYQKKKRKKGFLCRLQNSFRDYQWIT